MDPKNYTPEQKLDIEARVDRARGYLQELQLRPACIMQPVNMGNDVFGLKPLPYLADEKFTDTISPLTP